MYWLSDHVCTVTVYIPNQFYKFFVDFKVLYLVQNYSDIFVTFVFYLFEYFAKISSILNNFQAEIAKQNEFLENQVSIEVPTIDIQFSIIW